MTEAPGVEAATVAAPSGAESGTDLVVEATTPAPLEASAAFPETPAVEFKRKEACFAVFQRAVRPDVFRP
eukprot:11045023-Lingulodinium_polyedra.AAC.1